MPDAAEVKNEKDEELLDDEFEAGFDGKVTTEKAESPPEETKAEEVVAPKLRQVTEDEWNDLVAKLAIVDQLKEGVKKDTDKAFGKIGSLEQAFRTLQSATPQGISVDVTDDIVADLKETFPEIAEPTLKALKAFAGKVKGTAPAVSQSMPQTDIENLVVARIAALQEEDLAEDHGSDWRKVVGAPGSDTDYRKWLGTQDPAYQEKLNATTSFAVINRSLARFKADAKKAAEEAAAAELKKGNPAEVKTIAEERKKRLEAAATERGKGQFATATTEDDEFEAGFATG